MQCVWVLLDILLPIAPYCAIVYTATLWALLHSLLPIVTSITCHPFCLNDHLLLLNSHYHDIELHDIIVAFVYSEFLELILSYNNNKICVFAVNFKRLWITRTVNLFL